MWPDEDSFWPAGIPVENEIESFVALFASQGYEISDDSDIEPGVEKVALYADINGPTHAARQIPNGRWTSKLGGQVDVEHLAPETVSGGAYGDVVVILCRPERPTPAPE